MSRHVPRKDRWQRLGPAAHGSAELLVRFERGAWWADVCYRLLSEDSPPGGLPAWEPHRDRLGPFKRPRNAMVEGERHTTLLRNRHGPRIAFDPPLSLA